MGAILRDKRPNSPATDQRINVSNRVHSSSPVSLDLSRLWKQALAFRVEANWVEVKNHAVPPLQYLRFGKFCALLIRSRLPLPMKPKCKNIQSYTVGEGNELSQKLVNDLSPCLHVLAGIFCIVTDMCEYSFRRPSSGTSHNTASVEPPSIAASNIMSLCSYST
jgi:hypothetical protein